MAAQGRHSVPSQSKTKPDTGPMNRLETRAGNADNESSIHGGSRVESNGEEVLEGVRLVREAPEEEKRVVLLGSEKQESQR